MSRHLPIVRPRLVKSPANPRLLPFAVIKHNVLSLVGRKAVLTEVVEGKVTGAGGKLLTRQAPHEAPLLTLPW